MKRLLPLVMLFLSLPVHAGPLKFAAGFESTALISTPAVVVLVDVDNDGVLDAVTANSTETSSRNSITVQRGLGDGRFAPGNEYGTGFFPMGIAAADLNGDTWPDLVTANRGSSSVSVFLNDGDGTFLPKVNYGVGSGPRSVAVGDLDGDTFPDLVVTNSNISTISTLKGDGTGAFATKVDRNVALGVRSVRLVDWDGNGTLDVVAAAKGAHSLALLLGNGDGSFAAPQLFAQPAAPVALDCCDLDGDTRPDLLVAWENSSNVSTFLQQPGGALAPPTDLALIGKATDVVARDVTNDGLSDLIVANWGDVPASDFVSVFPGVGGAVFGTRMDFTTGGKPVALAVGDVDLSIGPDLAVACAGSASLAVHRLTASASFGSPRTFPGSTGVGEMISVDYNEDSILDLVAGTDYGFTWWLGKHGGSFEGPFGYTVSNRAPYRLALADVDGDLHLDAITIGNFSYDSILISFGTGNGGPIGRIVVRTSVYQILCVTPVDFDQDGRMDLVCGISGTTPNVVLLHLDSLWQWTESGLTVSGNGAHPFVNDIAIGDFNGDTFPDLLVSATGGISLVPSLGLGSFGAPVLIPGTSALSRGVVTDLDSDGKSDFVAYSATTLEAFRGDGLGGFTKTGSFATAGANSGMTAADLDRDGFIDVAVAGGQTIPGAPNVLSLLHGRGDGTFDPALDFGTSGLGPTFPAVADVTGDGTLDLIASVGGSITILENLLGPNIGVPRPSASGSVRLTLAPLVPNPSRGTASFDATLPVAGSLHVMVVDAAGRAVAHEHHDALPAGRQRLSLQAASRLKPGLYFLRVSQGTAMATARFVVAR